MFFPWSGYQKIKYKRKENIPARNKPDPARERRFLFKRFCMKNCCSGSMTLEAALVLPWFLFGMLAMLQFASIQTNTSALLVGMQDTAKEMAGYAYIQNMGISAGEGVAAEAVAGGLSAAYAKNRILSRTGVGSEQGSFHLLQTSFQDNLIDLAGTFKPAHTYTILPVKKVTSVVRARVRAWTGREGEIGETSQGEEEAEDEEEMVYVTETGHVYHKDENCTHIKLKIQTVSRSDLTHLRNTSGGKYHACDKCDGEGDTLYVSPYGNKYHSSLSCSGLKRTVKTVPVSEVENWKPCSKCGG